MFNQLKSDIKLDNVLVNYGKGDSRFAEIELADFGSTVHVDHVYCKNREIIRAPVWRSPECALGLEWGASTDIWSFGTVVSA